MTRKDIILISVLINAGLLAVLFVTAIHQEQDTSSMEKIPSSYEKVTSPVIEEIATLSPPPISSPQDEMDLVLKDYIPYISSNQNSKVEEFLAPIPQEQMEERGGEFVEIVVKKGDVLEKIAKANGITTEEIKRINQLSSDKLKIGQILKVPTSVPVVKNKEPAPAPKVAQQSDSQEPIYYTIKSGDNPWKIAKQFHVRSEDILKLNNLNEEKAKNLKIGDKIRVK